MAETDMVKIEGGEPLPSIERIWHRPHFRLGVEWSEGRRAGKTETIDLSPVINSYKIYKPLRGNEALFKTAKLIHGGDVIAWDGPDLEMTAEMIEMLAEQMMSPQDFAQFLLRNNLTQAEAAALLDRSRRQIGYYLSTGPIPRVVALACHGYEVLLKRNAVAATPVQTRTQTRDTYTTDLKTDRKITIVKSRA